MIRRPVSRPPVKDTRSTRGSVDSGAPAVAPAPSTRLPTPGGQAGLLEQPHQVDRGVRGELAGLEHERVAGGEAGRDLPRHLEERVVPRGDQAADADGLVDDPADHVGVAGVDDAARLLGGDAAVVAEDGDDVRDVVLALDEPLAGVERLHPRDHVGVALEQVGDPQQQVAPLPARGGRPGAVVEGAVRRVDRGLGVLGAGLVDLRDQGAVGRAADLAAVTGARCRPRPVHVEIRHWRTHSRHWFVAYVATGCSERNQPDSPRMLRSPPDRQGWSDQRDLPVTPAEPVRDLDGGLGDAARRPRRRGPAGSRNDGPETLIDATTSPWALRIGAATAVSPTSSSSTASA